MHKRPFRQFLNSRTARPYLRPQSGFLICIFLLFSRLPLHVTARHKSRRPNKTSRIQSAAVDVSRAPKYKPDTVLVRFRPGVQRSEMKNHRYRKKPYHFKDYSVCSLFQRAELHDSLLARTKLSHGNSSDVYNPAPMPLSAGTIFGPYVIVELLGAGGMGEVYRAQDTRLGRDVAINVYPESFAGDSDRLWRFEQEAQAVAALNHPNILAIHDIGTQNGAPYLVSELLEGNTLRAELRKAGWAHEKSSITRCKWRKAWPPRTKKISFIAI